VEQDIEAKQKPAGGPF